MLMGIWLVSKPGAYRRTAVKIIGDLIIFR